MTLLEAVRTARHRATVWITDPKAYDYGHVGKAVEVRPGGRVTLMWPGPNPIHVCSGPGFYHHSQLGFESPDPEIRKIVALEKGSES